MWLGQSIAVFKRNLIKSTSSSARLWELYQWLAPKIGIGCQFEISIIKRCREDNRSGDSYKITKDQIITNEELDISAQRREQKFKINYIVISL